MSEFEDIQKLIRLKRFETPGEGFTEEFLREFHQRQRAVMLKQSSVELLRERVLTWWQHLTLPKWTLASVTAAICVGGAWLMGDTQPTAPQTAATAPLPVPMPPVVEKPFIPKMDLSELPMANIAGRNDAKLEESLLRKHLEVRPVLEGNVQPLPASGDGVKPSLQNAVPAIHDGAEGSLIK